MTDILDRFIGKRVRVMVGDGVTPLGFGVYQGTKSIQIAHSEGHTLSHADGSDFTPEEQIELKAKDFDILEYSGTPVIQMDDGSTVYGCQVWWDVVEEN